MTTGKLYTGVLETFQMRFKEGTVNTAAMSQETTRGTENFERLGDDICHKFPLFVLCIRTQWGVCQIAKDEVKLLSSFSKSVKFHKAVSHDNLNLGRFKVNVLL